MKNTWTMVNAVWYDGCDAFVTKFIVKANPDDIYGQVNPESECLIEDAINGNGELLKIDILYAVTFDNILAFKDSDKPEDRTIYDRFVEMYF